MIALLRGEVAVRRPDHVVVLCGGVGYRAAVSAETLRHVPPVGEHGDAAHPPDRARRRAGAVRLPLRAGARPVPDAALGAGGRPEGRARGALGGAPAASSSGALAAGDAARFQAVPGHRQAHRRADHRRAAREGRPARHGARRAAHADRRAPRRGAASRARSPAKACSSSATGRSRSRSCCARRRARPPRS